jgi:hypothetical protein
MPAVSTFEIDVREKQVLVQPARHQSFTGARRVEQAFPLGDLLRLGGAGGQVLRIDRRSGRQPALQGLVLPVGQSGDGQWHAFFWVLPGVSGELAGHRAHILAADAQHDVVRHLGVRCERCVVAQFEHPCHQRRLTALNVQH